MLILFLEFIFASNKFRVELSSEWSKGTLNDYVLFYLNDIRPELVIKYLKFIDETKIKNDGLIKNHVKAMLEKFEYTNFIQFVEFNYFLPRINAFRNTMIIYDKNNDTSSIYITGKKPNFSLKNYTYNKQESETYFDFDIKFGSGDTIIYADLTQPDVLQFIKGLVNENKNFILRPTSLSDEKHTSIRGFGVELHYKDYELEVENIDGSKSLFNTTGINDFDIKFTQYVLDLDMPLPKALKEITQNWPKHIHKISKVEPRNETNHHIQMVSSIINEFKSSSSLNGRIIDLNNLDIYTLLSIIEDEYLFRQILTKKLHIDKSSVGQILAVPMEEKDSFILNFNNSYIKYLNDVETDPQTESWPTKVEDLLMPKEGIPKVRINLFNMITYVDPTTHYGITQLFILSALSNSGLPIRVGLCPIFNPKNYLSRKVGFAFHHLSMINEQLALKFLIESFKNTGINMAVKRLNPFEERHFYDAYQLVSKGTHALPWENIHHTFSTETKEYKLFHKTQEFVKQLGISSGYSTLNGKPLNNIESGYDNILKQIRDMMIIITDLVQQEGIKDLKEVNILKLLSKKFSIVDSLNPYVYSNKYVGFGLLQDRSNHEKFIDFFSNIKWDKKSDNDIYYQIFIGENISNKFKQEYINNSPDFSIVFNPQLPEFIERKIINMTRPLLISNGRILDQLNVSDSRTLSDIIKWTKHFCNPYISRLKDTKNRFIQLAYVTALAIDFSENKITRMPVPEIFFAGNSKLMFVDENAGALDWKMFINPCSPEAQRVSSLIDYVSENKMLNVYLLVAPPKITPRYNGFSTYRFDSLSSNDAMIDIDTTEALVGKMFFSPTFSVDILDSNCYINNIVLDEDKYIKYKLDGLLAQGLVKDNLGAAVDGIDMLFKTIDDKEVSRFNTHITGYFQFISTPGLYIPTYATERTNDLYDIQSSLIPLHSFSSKLIHIDAIKKTSKRIRDVPLSRVSPESIRIIDIVTFVSGKEYESLCIRMIESAVKHTKSKIRFWIPSEFLSDEFMKSIKTLSKSLDFEFNFIKFLWPNSFRKPLTEKLIMSAEKAIFIDSMLPLSIHRVLVVDADLLVKHDLTELFRTNLSNNSIAMPKFCKTNIAAYWKQSKWRQIAPKNLEYFSPSIIVIDLDEWRNLAAGDMMRVHYAGYGVTSTHIAYDLLNLAQVYLKITPLDDRWFWCQSYCNNTLKSSSYVEGTCGDINDIDEL